MTEFDANRLITMLVYNFAQFLPTDVQGAAIKKGTWMAEMMKYDAAPAEKAVRTIIQTCHFPPQIADFRDLMGTGTEYTRDDMLARLPGPTWETPEGMAAQYAFDHDRARRIMEALDDELRTGRFTKTKEEAIEANEVRLCGSF